MNSLSSTYDYLFKILLLGDSSVGKTCFLLRFADDTFNENHMLTVGVDYRLQMVKLQNEKVVKMQIWDTAGQDRFRTITKNYYKGAHGILLIYDVTSLQSFMNIRNWIIQVNDNTNEKVKIILVANKIDDVDNRKISREEGEKIANEYKLNYIETSAKENINVEESFKNIAEEIQKSGIVVQEKNTNVKLNNKNVKKDLKKNCCSK